MNQTHLLLFHRRLLLFFRDWRGEKLVLRLSTGHRFCRCLLDFLLLFHRRHRCWIVLLDFSLLNFFFLSLAISGCYSAFGGSTFFCLFSMVLNIAKFLGKLLSSLSSNSMVLPSTTHFNTIFEF